MTDGVLTSEDPNATEDEYGNDGEFFDEYPNEDE